MLLVFPIPRGFREGNELSHKRNDTSVPYSWGV